MKVMSIQSKYVTQSIMLLNFYFYKMSLPRVCQKSLVEDEADVVLGAHECLRLLQAVM